METMITHLRVTGGAESLELFTKNNQLEEKVKDMQKTIDSFSAGSSGLQARIKEKDESIAKLEKASADKDRAIASLETDKSNLNQTIADIKTEYDKLEKEKLSLQSTLDNIRQVVKE